MSDWTECTIGELGFVIGGGTPSREIAGYWDGCIPWLTPGEVTAIDEKYIQTSQDCISEIGLAKSGARLIPEGSLLVTSRASIGACALAGTQLATNQGFKILVPNSRVDASYLFHLGRTLAREMTRRASGTTFLEISSREFERICIRLPPLDEQQRIAEILDAIDDAICATERVLAKLGDLGSALLAQLALQCADQGTPVPLNSTGNWLSGGTPSTDEPSFWGGPIPWITASSLRGKYLSRSTRTLTAAGVRAGSRLVPPGTLICVVRGMSLKSEFRVGIAAVQLAFGQDCKALRPTGDWLPAYLHLQLSARELEVLRLVDEASHGTGRLQMPLLGALLVDRISLTEQRRVVTVLQAHEERVRAEEAALAKLRRLRAGLAEDLLSRRVRTVSA